MSDYIGDYPVGATVYVKFNSGGALAGSPVFAVYKNDSTTEITAGITLTSVFDDRAEFHHITVDTSADAAYTTGDYAIVCTAGTVGGESAVGKIVRTFSLSYRSNVAIGQSYTHENDATNETAAVTVTKTP